MWLDLEADGLFPRVLCSNTGVQCSHVREAPSTLVTRKRPLPSAMVQTGLQNSPLDEAFATFGTPEGLSTVRVQIDLQTSPDAVALVTLWALGGLLTTVNSSVLCEPVLLSETFATLRTREWFLATVLEQVAFQISFEMETLTALGTLEGLLPTADSHVLGELRLLSVGLAALAAGEWLLAL